MKIILTNNTSGEFPLIGGIPNLGPYAKQVLDITTVTFESLKSHLDSMKAKGLISYSIAQEASEKKAATPKVVDASRAEAFTEDLNTLRVDMGTASTGIDAKIATIESFLLGKITALEDTLQKLEARFAEIKPGTCVIRVDSHNTVSLSRPGYEPINGTEIVVPFTGNWLILGEIGIHSPLASKGYVAIGRTGFDASDKLYPNSERGWVRLNDIVSSVHTSCMSSLTAGDKISLYWKAAEGVIRGTYRSLTLISM